MSDIATKCSKYHFIHRSTCGFVPTHPAVESEGSVKPLAGMNQRDETTVALILIEFCCDEESALKHTNTAFLYIGVSADGEKASTLKDVLGQVERARAAALGLGMHVHVHLHASCPCTAGSPIRCLSHETGAEDIRFGELEPLLKRLLDYRKKVDSMSLEWPVNNHLWKLAGIKMLLKDLRLCCGAIVKLCRTGLVSKELKLPVGKKLRFVSDTEAFCIPLRKFQRCECAEHAPLNDVDWKGTGLYNHALAKVLNNAARACAQSAL